MIFLLLLLFMQYLVLYYYKMFKFIKTVNKKVTKISFHVHVTIVNDCYLITHYKKNLILLLVLGKWKIKISINKLFAPSLYLRHVNLLKNQHWCIRTAWWVGDPH